MIVIGLLRFAGLLNAAFWFGSACFFLLVAEPSFGSGQMQQLLGDKSFSYFSVAIGQVIGIRFWTVFLVCGIVAMLHTGAEWLYFGKYPKRFWMLLIFGLFLGGLLQTYGVQPKLRTKLLAQHGINSHPEQRLAAAHSFREWQAVSTGLDLALIGALGLYLWRVANPPDEMRFVGAGNFPGKFRS